MTRQEILKNAKPILFNTEIVRAILDGRKTETRRLPSKRIEDKWLNYEEWVTAAAPLGSTSLTEKEFYEEYPPYRPGDILYVRETWCLRFDGEKYFYKADKHTPREEKRLIDYDHVSWKPSIHMPKEATRIFLKVTNVRVERLEDMTNKDALKEGAQGVKCDHAGLGAYGCTDCMNTGWLEPPILEFVGIWNSTIKKSDLDRYGWNANPWVWVIEFERIEVDE